MFDFLKRKKKGGGGNDSAQTAATITAVHAAGESATQAAAKYSRPESYTGNRGLYDSQQAKISAKYEAFANNSAVTDPYTGAKLELTVAEAKAQYGADWAKHSAEADHVVPVEKVFSENSSNPFLTNEDIRQAVNDPGNIEVTSRQFNNAKRNRTNLEFVEDEDYLRDKGIELSSEAKRKAVKRGQEAHERVQKNLRGSTVRNVAETFHEAGKTGAYNSGMTALTMSGIMNVVAVAKGEKNAGEAIADTVKTGGTGALTGYVMGGGLTTLSQTLSKSSSAFLQGLAKSNVPGYVVTGIMQFGGTLKRYAAGEINTEEFILGMGERGLNFASVGYGMAVGQSLIPIPIVGAAVGALVGSALTSNLIGGLVAELNRKDLEHRERQRLIAEYKEAVRQEDAFRAELENYLQNYFKDFQNCFDDALSQMRHAFINSDADGMIGAANKITRKLGGKVYFENRTEFDAFLEDDSIGTVIL